MGRSISVLVGGAAGALCRWSVGLALAPATLTFPWATFVVNTTGAFGLGAVAIIITERMAPTRYLRSLIGIGFFGAYTTFSTMALEGVRLIDGGKVGVAVLYWTLTLLVGQAAGVYGMFIGRLGASLGREEREGPG